MLELTAPAIEQRLLERLLPSALQVLDESADHAGHVGANGTGFGTHFRVRIASPQFEGRSRVQRQGRNGARRRDLARKAPDPAPRARGSRLLHRAHARHAETAALPPLAGACAAPSARPSRYGPAACAPRRFGEIPPTPRPPPGTSAPRANRGHRSTRFRSPRDSANAGKEILPATDPAGPASGRDAQGVARQWHAAMHAIQRGTRGQSRGAANRTRGSRAIRLR